MVAESMIPQKHTLQDAQYEGWPVRVVVCREHADRLADTIGQVILTADSAECLFCRREPANG